MSSGGDHRGSKQASANATMSDSFGNLKIIISRLPKVVRSTLLIEDVVTSCRQCRGPVCPGREFCTQYCGLKYWERLRQENGKVSGRWLCSMPGCDKHCYIEKGGRVHDYCSKTHADQHKKMKGSCSWLPVPWTSASHHHGNSSQFTGSSSNPQPLAIGIGDHATRRDSTGPIYFYDKNAPFYEFTNFYPAPIFLDQRTWKTTEHYFQAQKFIGTPYLDVIQRCATPREAFDFSRKSYVSSWFRKDWDGVKIDIMRKALLAKFVQHDNLRRQLTGTGKRTLVERSPTDSFWGDGGDGSGQNWLGRLLMEIRDSIS